MRHSSTDSSERTARSKIKLAAASWWLCIVVAAISNAAEPAPSVSFREPVRAYERHARKFDIYVERSLATGDSKLANAALSKLEQSLAEVFASLPKRSQTELGDMRFYLLWGKESPAGGYASGMSYFRRGEPRNYPHLDSDWNHVIVVYSADNLMYLDSAWTRKALMHELAHAWHITHWPEKHPPILQAYQAAKAAGLYRQVKDRKGKVIPEGYALSNQLEYFAELSAMYFVSGNYFPFDRSGIAKYDPAGERLVRSLWGVE